jgi:lipoic acid synthetase
VSVPKFLLKRIPKKENIKRIRALIDDGRVHTVCESAKCPNIGECFSKNTLTFMILGNLCTRSCRFCGVDKGKPLSPDPDEPKRIAQAIKKLGLDYVVITSVTRDDIPGGGAAQFARVIQELKASCTEIKIEVLIPDFQGDEEALKTVLDANPYVLNHNVETVPRLYQVVRPQADYQRSLALLKSAKNSGVCTKSGFMVGLGENKQEVVSVLKDLSAVECNIVTIGQYLPPSKAHPRAERYVRPEEFKEYREIGIKLGLKVEAGPFVRSSYHAKDTTESL